jgi:hypothetical protein
VNREVGPPRAAAAQMEVLRTCANQVTQSRWEESVRHMVGAPQTLESLKALQDLWDAQAQKAARAVLIDTRDQIAVSFRGLDDKNRFLAAVGSL